MYEVSYKSSEFIYCNITYAVSFRDALHVLEYSKYGIKITIKGGYLDGFSIRKGVLTYLLNKLLN